MILLAYFAGPLIVFVYFIHQFLLGYWGRLGFHQLDPSFIVGDASPLFIFKTSIGEFIQDLYNKHKLHRALGIYICYRPVLIINDPELVQHILVKDFSSFHDRSMPGKDPLSSKLFNTCGQMWRDLRTKISPTFTSGKLQGMFPILKDCGDVLQDYLAKHFENGIDIFEFQDLMARFNTNVIASLAFGTDNDCINDRNNIFRRMEEKFFATNTWNVFRNVTAFFAKDWLNRFGIRTVDQDVQSFFFSITKKAVDQRKHDDFPRNDFLQQLIELKEKGFITVEKGFGREEIDKTNNIETLTLKQVAAAAFSFFHSGFETSGATMSFCLFELARNQEIQQKVHEEIVNIVKSSGSDKITFETVNKLKYLDMCVDETLRKYPVVPVLTRECTSEYIIPRSNVSIPKGAFVMIPVLGFHRDSVIFENPLQFKPERFLSEERHWFLGFGAGPRNCIGAQLVKYTIKVGLLAVLSKYSVELEDSTMATKELEFNPRQIGLISKKKINLKVVQMKLKK